jgi:hypothetical protein
MAGFEMNADQDDYFDAICTFVERYEAEHHPIDPPLTPANKVSHTRASASHPSSHS